MIGITRLCVVIYFILETNDICNENLAAIIASTCAHSSLYSLCGVMHGLIRKLVMDFSSVAKSTEINNYCHFEIH